MSVHRLYIGNTTPTVTPTSYGTWAFTTGSVRKTLTTAKDGSGTQGVTLSGFMGTGRLAIQAIGAVPRSGVLTGTFKTAMGWVKSVSGDTMYFDVMISVWNSAGTVKRGNLFAGGATATNIVQGASGSFQKNITGTLSSVTASIGDMLVVEFGVRVPAGSSGTVTNQYRASSGATDLSLVEDIATVGDPWVEFTLDDIPNPRGRVTQLGAEVLLDPTTNKVRVGQEYAEAMYAGNRARLSQSYAEVLYLPTRQLVTHSGQPVYVKREDGRWEPILLP